ncbi:MAG TPA: hypothetical protein VN207_10865 [Ktedonobacteraceae bacterium]|nr:hypothetical protein [Ktedonobacteraceae bacterium]
MQQIVTANVYCPFISQVNPLMEEARERAYSWLDQMELVRKGTNLEQTYRHTYLADYMGYIYPTAGFDELVWLTKLLVLTSFLDIIADSLDEKPLAYGRTMLSQCASLLTVDRIDEPDSQRLLSPALALSLHDIWREIFPHIPLHWRQRFSQNLGNYIMAHADETDNRVKGVIPDLESYHVLRSNTGMPRCLVDLVEYAEHFFLPPSVLLSPEMQMLCEAAGNHVIWVNDVFSRNKESLANDPHNLITVLQHDEQCSVPEAVEKACQMISSAARTVLEMGERLPTLFPDYANNLQRYVADLKSFDAGNCSWHCISPRYEVALPAETDETTTLYLVKPIVVTG